MLLQIFHFIVNQNLVNTFKLKLFSSQGKSQRLQGCDQPNNINIFC